MPLFPAPIAMLGMPPLFEIKEVNLMLQIMRPPLPAYPAFLQSTLG
jgi:hypothetical protein